MIIAINTIYPGHENPFIPDLFVNLANQNSQHTFFFIADASFDASINLPGNVKSLIVSPPGANPLLWKLWYDYKIPSLLKKNKADIFVTAGICSLRTKIPQCLFIIDSFLQYPQFFIKSHFNFYKKTTPKFINKAKVVITDSEVSKQIIAKKYKIADEKIDVIYPTANKILEPVDFETRESIKEKYADGNEYFLFPGDITPKNNLLNLLKAFSFFKKRQKSSMQLLICGSLGCKHEEFLESLRLFKFKNEVKVYNDLQPHDLADITASAYVMVYPLYFNNFDSAPINAMKCKVPVIITDNVASHETLADAALYVNPDNHKDIAEKMMLVFKDEELRKTLIQKGEQPVQNYKSDNILPLLWNSILKTSL